jgi:hypothetical protein
MTQWIAVVSSGRTARLRRATAPPSQVVVIRLVGDHVAVVEQDALKQRLDRQEPHAAGHRSRCGTFACASAWVLMLVPSQDFGEREHTVPILSPCAAALLPSAI